MCKHLQLHLYCSEYSLMTVSTIYLIQDCKS